MTIEEISDKLDELNYKIEELRSDFGILTLKFKTLNERIKQLMLLGDDDDNA